jgi:hypothetical protein
MQILSKKILSTSHTPEVILNPEGIIKIRGRSMMRTLTEFYTPIESWIDLYICNPAELTCIDFYLEYSNSNESVIFISILRKITYVKLKNKKLIVNWYYEDGDDDILEQGEYISSALNIPFNFIKIDDPLMPECNSLKRKHTQSVEL